jgi:hypothetical protein
VDSTFPEPTVTDTDGTTAGTGFGVTGTGAVAGCAITGALGAGRGAGAGVVVVGATDGVGTTTSGTGADVCGAGCAWDVRFGFATACGRVATRFFARTCGTTEDVCSGATDGRRASACTGGVTWMAGAVGGTLACTTPRAGRAAGATGSPIRPEVRSRPGSSTSSATMVTSAAPPRPAATVPLMKIPRSADNCPRDIGRFRCLL